MTAQEVRRAIKYRDRWSIYVQVDISPRLTSFARITKNEAVDIISGLKPTDSVPAYIDEKNDDLIFHSYRSRRP